MRADDPLIDQAQPEQRPALMRRFKVGARELGSLLWRRHAEIVLVALIFAAGAVAICLSLTPRYTSTAQLYVDPRELLFSDRDAEPDSLNVSSMAMVIESQLRLIISNSVLLQVVQDTHLDEDPEFSRAAKRDAAPMVALENLRRHIEVTQPDQSFIINVEVWSKDPAKSALLANAICNAYLNELKQSQVLAVRRAATYLSDRLKELQERIHKAESALAAYQAQHNSLDAQGALISEQQLVASGKQLAAAHTATLDAQAKYDRIEASRRQLTDIDDIPEALQSPGITSLRAQYARARRRHAELLSEFGPQHPALRQINNQMDDLRRRINEEIERLSQSAMDELAHARDTEASLNQEIESHKHQLSQLSQPSPRLRELQGNVETSRDVYQSFLERWRQTDGQKSLKTLSARVVGEATTTGRRSFPPAMSLFAGTGFMLGALAASGWFAAAGRRPAKPLDPQPADTPISPMPSPSLQPPQSQPPAFEPPPEAQEAAVAPIERPLIARLLESAVERTQSSVLTTGALPDLTRIGWPTLRRGLVQRTFLNVVGEMRATLARRPSAGAIPVMAVIGAGASEDRSIAALNLALAAARSGARVLLVDADHATHALSNQLHGPGKSRAGRFGWISVGLKASVAIETTNGIAVLPIDRGSDTKASSAICKTIAEVRSLGGYDLVILDGPATPSSAADRRLLDVADGLVADLPFGIEINDRVHDIIAALGDAGPKLIGFVINELLPSTVDPGRDKPAAERAAPGTSSITA